MTPHMGQADTNLEAELDRLTYSAYRLTLDPGKVFSAMVRAIDGSLEGTTINSDLFERTMDLALASAYDVVLYGSFAAINSKALDQILAQTDERTKIVPGHRPFATRADLHGYHDMLVQVRQRIEVLIAAGQTIDEAVTAAPRKDLDSKWGRGYVTPEVFTRLVFSSITLSSRGER